MSSPLTKDILDDVASSTSGDSTRDNSSEEDVHVLKHRDTKAMKLKQREERMRKNAFTRAEVAQHNSKDSLWIVVEGKVYDVTSWYPRHPGGELAILNLAGQDVTDGFYGFHPPSVLKNRLPNFQIGVIKNYEPSAIEADLARIRTEMRAEGLYNSTYYYYFKRFMVQVVLFALAMFCMRRSLQLHADPAWNGSLLMWVYTLLGGGALGIFWQQLAFIGHDLGHNSVTHVRKWDQIIGLFTSMLAGVSISWWKRNHNVHHLVTNSLEHDPDIQHIPVFAISKKFFANIWSTYYEKEFTFDKVAQILVSYQHYLYYPVMAVAKYNLTLQSLLLVCNPYKKVEKRGQEIFAMVTYIAWYCYLLSFFPTWGMLWAFNSMAFAFAGIVHVQITLSHFPMPAYHGTGFDHEDPGAFLATQLATTLNVDCYRYLDWFHGGLQFQTEHHIFPRVSRQYLRYVRDKYVKPLARKHNLPYHQCTFFEANKRVISTLREAAYQARLYRQDSENYLAKMINAEG